MTSMMLQYLEIKEQYKDFILFYRPGDFYEMFFQDAITASRELELTLTGKSCGMDDRAPMCGVPFHSAGIYIQKLVAKGFKVAICEQLEDAKEAIGLVSRGVVRVVTPGTLTDENKLDEKTNNYLCVAFKQQKIALCFCDVSTSEVYVTIAENTRSAINEIARYSPSES